MTATVETQAALSVPCPLCKAPEGASCVRVVLGVVGDREREPHKIRKASAVLANPELESCEACNAEPGEPCRFGCLGYALAMGEL